MAAEADREKYKESIEVHIRQITSLQTEINILIKRCADHDAESERDKKDIARLKEIIRIVNIASCRFFLFTIHRRFSTIYVY